MLNLFSIQRACSDFLLYGHELLTPDHHVLEVPAHHSGLRLHPLGLQVVKVRDPPLSFGRPTFYYL